MDCWSYWGQRKKQILKQNFVVGTLNGLQIGPIKVPVANTYDKIMKQGNTTEIASLHEPTYVACRGPELTETNNDVDNEYDYIMTRALKSYKLHRDRERADNRQKQLRSAYCRRWLTTKRIQSAGSVRDEKSPATIRSYSSRPKSAISSHMDAIREVGQANDLDDRKSKPVKRPINVKLVTLPMEDSPKGIAFQKRNQTSQTWYSHSFPSSGFLNNTMRLQYSANSKTDPSTSRTEEKSSRPESARSKYEYDGGIFDTSKYPKKEYFVIHPDWVSEAMTIQKLSLNDRKPVRSSSWPGRRCKSAPPPKYRNIITWENPT